MTAEPKTATCASCGAAYTYTPILLWGQEVFNNGLCHTCDEQRVAEARLQHEHSERMKRHNTWDHLDLPLKDTDVEQLPHPRGKVVAKWPYSAKGPFCAGPSGQGKSRSLIALCRRLWIEEAKEFKFLSWAKWCDELDAASRYGTKERERLIDGVCRWPMVVVDDVGKGKPQEAHVVAFFRLIDYRTSRGLPTAISTKYQLTREPGSPFETRLAVGSKDTAADLCRRLVQTSTNCPFN